MASMHWLSLVHVVAVLTCGAPAFASAAPTDNTDEAIAFVTNSGRTYNDAKVSRVTPYSIVVVHPSGVAQIDFEDLPPSIQAKYQYDPDRAKAAKLAKQQHAAAARAAHRKEWRRYGKFYDHLQSLQQEATKFTTSSVDQSLSERERHARSRQVHRVIADHREKLLKLKQAVAALELQQVPEARIVEHLDAVYARRVFAGMQKDFVLMAWGKPDDVSAIQSEQVNHEQWHYQRTASKSEHLTVVDGKVTEIASTSYQ